jgi:hypothetical protein
MSEIVNLFASRGAECPLPRRMESSDDKQPAIFLVEREG